MFEADGSLMLYWYALGDVAQGEGEYCGGPGGRIWRIKILIQFSYFSTHFP